MTDAPAALPLVVGIGGTIGGISSTERALRIALDAACKEGFRTQMFGGADMARLPLYDPRATVRTEHEREFVDTIRQASALIIASPVESHRSRQPRRRSSSQHGDRTAPHHGIQIARS